jgi:hypothetical protein
MSKSKTSKHPKLPIHSKHPKHPKQPYSVDVQIVGMMVAYVWEGSKV